MDVTPVILWLADNPRWAYASIVKQISEQLPAYHHQMIGMMSDTLSLEEIKQACSRADVVVAMYLLYANVVPETDKLVLMLTGSRPFEKEAGHAA